MELRAGSYAVAFRVLNAALPAMPLAVLLLAGILFGLASVPFAVLAPVLIAGAVGLWYVSSGSEYPDAVRADVAGRILEFGSHGRTTQLPYDELLGPVRVSSVYGASMLGFHIGASGRGSGWRRSARWYYLLLDDRATGAEWLENAGLGEVRQEASGAVDALADSERLDPPTDR